MTEGRWALGHDNLDQRKLMWITAEGEQFNITVDMLMGDWPAAKLATVVAALDELSRELIEGGYYKMCMNDPILNPRSRS